MTPIKFVEHCKWLAQGQEPQDYRKIVEDLMTKARAINIEPQIDYFLFGAEAVKVYEEKGEGAFLKACEDNELVKDDYVLVAFNQQLNTFFDVLLEYDGWGDYCRVEKGLYDTFN